MSHDNFRAFGYVLRVTIVILMLHITSFLGYQNPWPQELLSPNSTIPRLVTCLLVGVIYGFIKSFNVLFVVMQDSWILGHLFIVL